MKLQNILCVALERVFRTATYAPQFNDVSGTFSRTFATVADTPTASPGLYSARFLIPSCLYLVVAKVSRKHDLAGRKSHSRNSFET
jgi:hypothetical protein